MAKKQAAALDSTEFPVFQDSFFPLTVAVDQIQKMFDRHSIALILQASFTKRKKTKLYQEDLMFRLELHAAGKSDRE